MAGILVALGGFGLTTGGAKVFHNELCWKENKKLTGKLYYF